MREAGGGGLAQWELYDWTPLPLGEGEGENSDAEVFIALVQLSSFFGQ